MSKHQHRIAADTAAFYPTQRCKCGTDALGGCKVHTAASMRLVETERDRLREGLRNLIDQTPGSHPGYQAALDALLGPDHD